MALIYTHSNNFKKTALASFSNLKKHANSASCHQIIIKLQPLRDEIIKLFSTCCKKWDTKLDDILKEYLSLIIGFTRMHPDIKTNSDSNKQTFISNSQHFTWTSSISNGVTKNINEFSFEYSSILLGYIAVLSNNVSSCLLEPNIGDDILLACHKKLRKCLFFIQKLRSFLNSIPRTTLFTDDLNDNILQSYESQLMAEIQEITINKAIVSKHNPRLICDLCCKTMALFDESASNLKSVDSKQLSDNKYVNGWLTYLEFKTKLMMCMAYLYYGEELFTEKRIGSAISCIKEAKNLFTQLRSLGLKYYDSKASKSINPTQLLFFTKLESNIDTRYDFINYENNLLHHQKMDLITCPLPNKPNEFGSASPLVDEDYFNINPLWTNDAFSNFKWYI